MPTARFADMVISRFEVEKMEGGVVIAGRSFHTSSHCRVLVILFACFFLLAGVVLTILAYRPLTDSNTHYLRHLSGSQIAGPCLVVIGLVFLGVGIAIHLIAKRLNHPVAKKRYRTTCCFSGARRWLMRAPSTTLSSIKRRRMIDDLMHHSSQIHYKVSFSGDDNKSERGDVASFPDSCFIHKLRANQSNSPIVKIKTIS